LVLLFLAFNARGGAIRFIISTCKLKTIFVGWARFFTRHDAINVALFGVQNSVHTLPGRLLKRI
jgi:hypothetical protein